MEARDLGFLVLLAAAVLFGHKLHRLLDARSRSTPASSFGEPGTSPYQERIGLVLALVALAGAGIVALLFAKACRFVE